MDRLLSIPRKMAQYGRSHGLTGLAHELHHRLVNGYHERRLGITTATRIRLSDVGVDNTDARDSMPIGYGSFYSILKKIPLAASETTFLDFGVGTGRAICAAATFPFRRIVGVDISEVLLQTASTNLERMKHRRTQVVELSRMDAAEFSIPKDVNLIYFFNPFAGETLRSVLNNIQASATAHSRKMHIIYFNNDHFEKLVRDQAWIEKIYQTEFYPKISCGIYVTRATRNAAGADSG